MTAPQKATPGGSGQASADQTSANAHILPDADAARQAAAAIDKRTKTLQAQFALAGLQMHVVGGVGGAGAGGGGVGGGGGGGGGGGAAEFWISRWGMTKVCSSLADAEAFADQAGVTR